MMFTKKSQMKQQEKEAAQKIERVATRICVEQQRSSLCIIRTWFGTLYYSDIRSAEQGFEDAAVMLSCAGYADLDYKAIKNYVRENARIFRLEDSITKHFRWIEPVYDE